MLTKKQFRFTSTLTVWLVAVITALSVVQCGDSKETTLPGESSSVVQNKSVNGGSPFLFPYFVPDSHPFDSSYMDTTDTNPISKTKVDSAVKAYADHPGHLTIPTRKNPGGEILKGYVVNMSRIKNLLDKNPARLYLQYGVRPELIIASDSEQHFTLIISGYDNAGNIIKQGTKPMYYEYIRPCPPDENCP